MGRRSMKNPSVRAFLIAEVLAFVRAARQVSGVTRIALIGSLTTEKPEPKDADLLVTVTEDVDLEPLARLGRRLQGRAQSINHDGDIFLANPKGKYLGRTATGRSAVPEFGCRAMHSTAAGDITCTTTCARSSCQRSLLPPRPWNYGPGRSFGSLFPKTWNGNSWHSSNRKSVRNSA
jgi:predicted nucleotidyltransferase